MALGRFANRAVDPVCCVRRTTLSEGQARVHCAWTGCSFEPAKALIRGSFSADYQLSISTAPARCTRDAGHTPTDHRGKRDCTKPGLAGMASAPRHPE